MILSDEIRGRLAEVFSLKQYKIDHVVHGAIASAASYGAMMGATAEQIESAIGMVVAHYIPFRAIRAGKQLSDSKGSSAAISTEAAVLSMRRAMRGENALNTRLLGSECELMLQVSSALRISSGTQRLSGVSLSQPLESRPTRI